MSRDVRSVLDVRRLEERLAPAFVSVGTEFRFNKYTVRQLRNRAVDMDANGDSLVVWESTGQDGNIDGVYCQL